MNKIVLDYTFLKALLKDNDDNHELAENMAMLFDAGYTLYIPYHIFIELMNMCNDFDNQIREEVFLTLTNTCRIQHTNNKQIYNNYLARFLSEARLNFSDCLTIEFMKEKSIRNIISFNEKFDLIKGVNRAYDFDEYNQNRLNFIKYSDS